MGLASGLEVGAARGPEEGFEDRTGTLEVTPDVGDLLGPEVGREFGGALGEGTGNNVFNATGNSGFPTVRETVGLVMGYGVGDSNVEVMVVDSPIGVAPGTGTTDG